MRNRAFSGGNYLERDGSDESFPRHPSGTLRGTVLGNRVRGAIEDCAGTLDQDEP